MEKATDKQVAFLNKHGIYGEKSKQEASEMISGIIDKLNKEEEKPEVVKIPEKNGAYDTTGMYTSYAKDIYCSIPMETRVGLEKQNMELAIKLVKQAKEAFK